MSFKKISSAIFVLMIFGSNMAHAGGGSGTWTAEPEGMFSPTPVLQRSCVAVRIDLTQTQALSGVRWYHNDSSTVFPKIMVASGLKDYPPLYADGMVVVEDATGVEVGWSVVSFSEPVASETGSLYVIFQLPVNTEGVDVGDGPGFGYVATDNGSCVYLSSDGDDWSRLVTDYQLLVDPVYTTREPGFIALSSSQGDEDERPIILGEGVVARTELLRPYPNPFNPQATVSFSLKVSGQARLDIYDIRGRLVKVLADEHMEAGYHSYTWLGRDRSGRRASSVVYFVRLKANNLEQIQRMTLIK